jgi:hypothetical protein
MRPPSDISALWVWTLNPRKIDNLPNSLKSGRRAFSFDKNHYLFIYCFTSCSRVFHIYGDVTITGEGLQNLSLCSALRAFEQGEMFIVPHLLWHGASVCSVSSEGPPHSVSSYDTQGMWRIYSNPDPHGSPISRFLRHKRGCGEPILTPII